MPDIYMKYSSMCAATRLHRGVADLWRWLTLMMMERCRTGTDKQKTMDILF